MSDKIDYKLGELSAKVDLQGAALSRMEATLDRNTASLTEHMKRTDLAEQNLAHLRETIQPIEDHVKFIRSLMKLGTWLAGLIGAVAAGWGMFH